MVKVPLVRLFVGVCAAMVLALVGFLAYVVITPSRLAAQRDFQLMLLADVRDRINHFHHQTGEWPREVSEMAEPVCTRVCLLTAQQYEKVRDMRIESGNLCLADTCLELGLDGGNR